MGSFGLLIFLCGCAAMLSGCTRPVFTDEDTGRSVDVARGSEFSISLPSIRSSPRPAPQLHGAFIRFLGRRIDADREVFDFSAEGTGEGEIRISPPGNPETSSSQEYVIQVRIAGRSAGAGPAYSQPERRPGTY